MYECYFNLTENCASHVLTYIILQFHIQALFYSKQRGANRSLVSIDRKTNKQGRFEGANTFSTKKAFKLKSAVKVAVLSRLKV